MAEKTVAAPPQSDGLTAAQEGTRAHEKYVAPPVDIYETSEGLVVLADLPGVSKDLLDIQVKNDMLTLQARSGAPYRGAPIHSEFELASFFRQFQLSDTVDTQNIRAELKHGVLTLMLPKAEAAKPKRIEVSVS